MLNTSQQEYLEKYSSSKHISQEEAMTHAIVKTVLEQLESKKGMGEIKVSANNISCNCS